MTGRNLGPSGFGTRAAGQEEIIVRVRRFVDAARLLEASGDFVLAHEAEHNLILGICSGLLHGEWADHPPYLAAVVNGSRVVAVAIRTPPRSILLSRCEESGALRVLLSDLAASLGELPGAIGPTEVARVFAEGWCQATGGRSRLAMRQRIYRLDRVRPVVGEPGLLRPVGAGDRHLLMAWIADFQRCEAGIVHDAAAQIADRFLAGDFVTRGLYFWEVAGRPVSMVGHMGATPNGMRIGPVYTPEAHRRRGYASAAVAALCQKLLNSGRRFCFLYTDLANPTSNHIYQAIGFEPVADSAQHVFSL